MCSLAPLTLGWVQYDTVLGKGAFKTVYKGFDEREGIEVAWNQVCSWYCLAVLWLGLLNVLRYLDRAQLHRSLETQVRSNDYIKEGQKLTHEISVLKNMKHGNVMCFYDSWIDKESGTVNFITELFTSGTLRQYVDRRLLSCTLLWRSRANRSSPSGIVRSTRT